MTGSNDDDYVPESTQGLDEAAFLASYPFPVVLIGEPDLPPETTEFMTLAGKNAALLAQGAATKPGRLMRVRKRGGNPFAMMMTIGRAANNDIHIPTKDVSKFHAYFSRAGDDWQITDAGSTNGTFLAGKQLPVRETHPVRIGEPLIIGSTQITLLIGSELYAYLRDHAG